MGTGKAWWELEWSSDGDESDGDKHECRESYLRCASDSRGWSIVETITDFAVSLSPSIDTTISSLSDPTTWPMPLASLDPTSSPSSTPLSPSSSPLHPFTRTFVQPERKCHRDAGLRDRSQYRQPYNQCSSTSGKQPTSAPSSPVPGLSRNAFPSTPGSPFTISKFPGPHTVANACAWHPLARGL